MAGFDPVSEQRELTLVNCRYREPGGLRPGSRMAVVPSWRGAGWLVLAWLCLLLALLGVALPGLPTTPFVLLAAAAAARGSERLHRRLREHRRFGRIITDWEREGAVSLAAKRLASLSMILCALVIHLTAPVWWLAVPPWLIMAAVAVWLWLRPSPGGHDSAAARHQFRPDAARPSGHGTRDDGSTSTPTNS